MRTSLAADVRKFPTSDAWALPASDDDEDGHDDDNDDDYDSIGSVIIYIYIYIMHSHSVFGRRSTHLGPSHLRPVKLFHCVFRGNARIDDT